MYARMSRIAGLPPERIDEARQYFEQQELPALEHQKGFDGVLVMVDRADGRATAITFWQTQEDMRASDRAADEARAATLEQVRSSEPSREPLDGQTRRRVCLAARLARTPGVGLAGPAGPGNHLPLTQAARPLGHDDRRRSAAQRCVRARAVDQAFAAVARAARLRHLLRELQ